MKTLKPFILLCSVCFLVGLSTTTILGQGTAFTYQGKLNNNGAAAAGSYDFRFRLAADNAGNTYVGSAFLTNGVPVTNGLFTTTIDFGAGIFGGANYWLEVDVRTNGAGGYTALYPLQAVTPTPYAIYAGTATTVSGPIASSSLPPSANFSGTVVANALAGNGLNVTNVNATALNGLVAGNFWQLGGNNVSAGQFFGSTNNQPVEIWVNGLRTLRMDFGGVSAYASGYGYTNLTGAPNLIGGAAGNFIAPGVVGAVISGGGATNFGGSSMTNTIGPLSDFSFIGGGIVNSIQSNAFTSVISGGENNTIQTNAYGGTIGGGNNNTIQTNAIHSTIGGGNYNTIQTNAGGSTISGGEENTIQRKSFDSTIGGGLYNIIQTNAIHSTIGGGNYNTIQANASGSTISGGEENTIQTNAFNSTIGGGYNNTIQPYATYATIAGGLNNVAYIYSFAAGCNAQATNNGTFVWSDGTGTATASINNNSVTMRASGGYRFFTSTGVAGAQLAANATSWTTISDRNAKKNFQPVDTVVVLDKLATVPVQEWNYKWENNSDVPNIGPMAQDFKHAFYPGRDDKGISTLEFDGVELAAIQGLNQKLNSKDAEIAALKIKAAQMDLLTARLNELEDTVKALEKKK